MSEEDERRVETWDLSAEVADPRTVAFAAAYDQLLAAHAADLEPSGVDPADSAAREAAQLQRQVEATRRQLQELRASPSFRLGHTLVRTANRLGAGRLVRSPR